MPDEGQIMPRGRPDPDPTVLTTDALNREVARLTELMDLKVNGLREVMEVKFSDVAEKFTDIEDHRREQKQDTLREITKAFDANSSAIEAVEKIQGIDSARITAVESTRQGGIDMRVAIFAVISLGILVVTVLGANGVFTR